MPANQTIVPVLFTAAADAPLAGRLADVVGQHERPEPEHRRPSRANDLMVRGQNNINVWTHTADRMAMAR